MNIKEVREIFVSPNYMAIVDVDMFELVNGLKWQSFKQHGVIYPRRKTNKREDE